MVNIRWAIYKERAEVNYQTNLTEAVSVASLDSTNDITRKIVATFDTLNEARNYLAKNHSRVDGYKNRYSNRVYDVEMYIVYEEEYDEEYKEWIPTGNSENAPLDPEQIHTLSEY